MYRQKAFPYPLTQLEGFDPTTNEQKVLASPAFQQLRKDGLPMFGTLGSTLSYGYLPPHNVEKGWGSTVPAMSPTALSDFCAEKLDLIRKSVVLTGQIREMLSNGNVDPNDQRLLQDLTAWLNYTEVEQFRWEEHWNALEERVENADWYRQVAEFQASGNSDLVVLLTSSFSREVRRQVRNHLVDGAGKLKGLHLDHRSYWAPFLPQTHSIWDPHNGGEVIDDTSMAVIDCGDIARVKSWIADRRLQRQITAVRFELPRSCFVGSLHWSVMSAPMLIFDVEALEDGSRALALGRLKIWLEERQAKPELRTNNKSSDQDWQATQVLVPANDAQLCAVIIAGPASERFGWDDAFHDLEEAEHLFKEGMSVSRAKTADD